MFGVIVVWPNAVGTGINNINNKYTYFPNSTEFNMIPQQRKTCSENNVYLLRLR